MVSPTPAGACWQSRKPDVTPPDPRRERAYKLYVIQDWPLRAIEKELHLSKTTIRRWIIEQGGKIRNGGERGERKTQTGPGQTQWREKATCSIGHRKTRGATIGGGWYCARYCEHGRCDEEATAQDLAVFAELEVKRQAAEKLRRERKTGKLSGAYGMGALWRK